MSDISIQVIDQGIEVSVTETDVEVGVQQETIEIVVAGGVGPQGPPGTNGIDGVGANNPTVIFNQELASEHWVVNHSFPGFPAVTVVDTSGRVIEGEVLYTSATRIDIYFFANATPVAISGKAYLN